ncbi:hypothetical protein P3T76_011913 [Phytophthora citrophthora]|uniref:Uncharacterized protein n=1 Tax=Phytophthora citrophthora TaxID=4793 RepID=A0AAD9LFR3_9STRA|nr:hypothetical protein P3T76_011913 [Phytophthora citrophthora]
MLLMSNDAEVCGGGISPCAWHLVKPALKRYFELNGHTDIPYPFRIDHGDEKWPDKLWDSLLEFEAPICADETEESTQAKLRRARRE